MNPTIYEFLHEFGEEKFHSCTSFVVEKKTEKMFFGTVYYHGTNCGSARIAKHSLGKAIRVASKMHTLLRVRLFAENFESAQQKAAEIVYRYYMDAAKKITPLTALSE